MLVCVLLVPICLQCCHYVAKLVLLGLMTSLLLVSLLVINDVIPDDVTPDVRHQFNPLNNSNNTQYVVQSLFQTLRCKFIYGKNPVNTFSKIISTFICGRLSSVVVVCNTALHGGPVVLRHVRATPCFLLG